MCGSALFGEARCARHFDSVRVLWTKELGAAFMATLRAAETGVAIPLARVGVYRRAYELARFWGQVAVEEAS